MGTQKDALWGAESRLTTEVAEFFPRQKHWTEDEYFALPDTLRFVELSKGELIVPPHPTDSHQCVVGTLYELFRSHVKATGLGVVRLGPLPVRLWPDQIREPDIQLLLNEHAARIGEQFWGPPDLVVEVLSPSTRKTDREDKFREYAQAGIPEYWIVDPQAVEIEVYVLRNGVYALLVKAGRGDRVRSQLLDGFEVGADEVFAR
jgi:Uma2 family endonuclease